MYLLTIKYIFPERSVPGKYAAFVDTHSRDELYCFQNLTKVICKGGLTMIRKYTLIFALILSLLACGALAQGDAYVPGQAAAAHFAEAFASGKMLRGDFQVQLSIDPSAMGPAAAEAEALSKTLPNAQFSFGAGRIENGLRLELGASYAQGESAAADAALNVTQQGLLLETSLLEGESFSIGWETLLALCGLSDEEIQIIMTPIRMGPEAAVSYLIETSAALISAAEPYLQLAAQSLAPYGETIAAFLASLPVSIAENTPGEDFYPAAAQEITVSITARDAGSLLILLADQLQGDAALSMLIDIALSQQAETSELSTQQLCDAVRQAAARLTDTAHPLTLRYGMDAAGAPLYFRAACEDGAGSLYVAEIIHNAGLVPGADRLMFNAYRAPNGAAFDAGLTFHVDYAGDSYDANVHNFSSVLSLHEDGMSVLTAVFDSAVAAEGSGELAAYRGGHLFSIDTGNASMVLSIDSLVGQTAEGGEHTLYTGALDLYAAGSSFPMTFANEFTFTPTADGPTAVYTESASIPQYGVTSAKETYSLYTGDYDPSETAALQLTQYETASQENLQALLSRLQASLQDLAGKLPPEALQLLNEIL